MLSPYVELSETYSYGILHTAAEFCRNIDQIQEIIQLDHTNLIKRCSNFSLAPLGLFLQYNMLQCDNWKDIVNCFLNVNSCPLVIMDAIIGCVRHINDGFKKMNNTPLVFTQSYENEVLEFICYLLDKYPEVINFLDTLDNKNLLHRLLNFPNNLSLKLINIFLGYNKDLVRQFDSDGRLPLHIYAQYHYEENVDCDIIFNLLVSLYPESVPIIDHLGESILHYDSPFSVLTFVCQHYPELLRHRIKAGRTPLHELLGFYTDADISNFVKRIQIMYNSDPSICELRCEISDHYTDVESIEGYLPLHLFIRNCDSKIMNTDNYIQCLKFLLNIYPAAVNIRGKDGLTPYSIARLRNTDVNDKVRRLLLKVESYSFG